MAQDSGSQRRAEAAALRAEAEKAAARDKRIKVLGGVAVAVVAVGIVLAGYLGAQASKPKPIQADPTAARPAGTLADTYGWPIQPVDSAKSTLVIYEDPQCPICKLFEKQFSSDVRKLVTDGKINLVYQMATFIDVNLPQSNHASRRAIAGLGCAIDAGKGLEYHDLVYANQPATEGAGYSDALLKKLGKQAGITGDALTTFNSCFDEGKYLGWADNLNQQFQDKGIQGTPTLVLDGTTVPDTALTDNATLVAYLTKHAK